jgi:hypothetical protein
MTICQHALNIAKVLAQACVADSRANIAPVRAAVWGKSRPVEREPSMHSGEMPESHTDERLAGIKLALFSRASPNSTLKTACIRMQQIDM